MYFIFTVFIRILDPLPAILTQISSSTGMNLSQLKLIARQFLPYIVPFTVSLSFPLSVNLSYTSAQSSSTASAEKSGSGISSFLKNLNSPLGPIGLPRDRKTRLVSICFLILQIAMFWSPSELPLVKIQSDESLINLNVALTWRAKLLSEKVGTVQIIRDCIDKPRNESAYFKLCQSPRTLGAV